MNRKFLVIGGSGFVGRRLLEMAPAGLSICSTGASRKTGIAGIEERLLDVTDADAMTRIIDDTDPDVMIFLAKSSAFDADAGPFELAFESLVRTMRERGTRFVYLSTDAVFDGLRGMYDETDAPNPLRSYGKWKRFAEEAVLDTLSSAVVIRTGLIYGRNGDGFDKRTRELLDAVSSGCPVVRFVDAFRSFAFVDDLSAAIWNLSDSDFSGIIHIAGPRMGFLDYSRRLVAAFGFDPALVTEQDGDAPEGFARDTSLDTALAKNVLGFEPTPLDRF
ncbi:MAG: sugar nucleotide-binding protein [Candidatus Moranbacteria bacterium]|nr:sugar nucleotide-binding protein [Candidatus Moranbacteria bacterium]